MKISKELLTTIAAGLLMGATVTSCEKSEFFDSTCIIDCESEHDTDDRTYSSDDCPACGLG